jgi:hypothetical protein
MITPHKQWILEVISRTKKMEGMVATCDGSGGSPYSENRKAQGEGATADDFEIFRERGKMMPQRLVRSHGTKKLLRITSKLIFSCLKGQIPGSHGVGNRILVRFHPVKNSCGGEYIRVNVVFWLLVIEIPSTMKWLCGIWTWCPATHMMRSM